MAGQVKSLYLANLHQTLRTRVLDWKTGHVWYDNPPRADHTALRVTGGIGDLVLAIGPAEALNQVVGDVVIYSGWPEIAQLFTKIPCRHKKPLDDKGLDLIINLNSLCIFQFARNWKGFHRRALRDLFIANQRFLGGATWRDIAEHHPYLDNVLGRIAPSQRLTRYDVTFASLGLESQPFYRPLQFSSPHKTPYVTIHDGFDVANKRWGASRATKTWGIWQWERLVDTIHCEFPGLEVVQIGGPTSRRVPGVDIDLVAALPFNESLRWLQHSKCHFDGDSGLMHSAHAMRVNTVCLFGPTPAEFFGYRDNVNISASYCGGCWWLTPDWVSKCPMGYETPKCMDSITPAQVFLAFKERFGDHIEEALCKTKNKSQRPA